MSTYVKRTKQFQQTIGDLGAAQVEHARADQARLDAAAVAAEERRVIPAVAVEEKAQESDETRVAKLLAMKARREVDDRMRKSSYRVPKKKK